MMAGKMMGGMAGAHILGFTLSMALLLGFAYIVWVLASKESGNIKTIGKTIAAVIAIVVGIIILYGGIYGGLTGQCGDSMMMKHKIMME